MKGKLRLLMIGKQMQMLQVVGISLFLFGTELHLQKATSSPFPFAIFYFFYVLSMQINFVPLLIYNKGKW